MLAGLFSILFQIIPYAPLVFLVPLNTELMFPENDLQKLQDSFSALKYLMESPQLHVCMGKVIPLTVYYFTFDESDGLVE